MGEVVVGQVALRQKRVDQGEAGGRPVAHGDRHGAVEFDHRRRRDVGSTS